MSANVARLVHELVRVSAVRRRFQKHCQAYVARRIENRSLLWPLQLADVDDLWEHEGVAPATHTDVTLNAKYAALAALHDNSFENDGPIMPRGDCLDSASRIWHLLLGHVARDGSRHAKRLEDWYKDVVVDLEGKGLLDKSAAANALVAVSIYNTSINVMKQAGTAIEALPAEFWAMTAEHAAEHVQDTSEPSEPRTKIDPEAHAIALLYKRPDLSLAEIASKVGVKRTTLYRWRKFCKAAELAGKYRPKANSKDSSIPRGSKSSDGTIEAWDEPQPD
jgi:hypothetical protein